MENYYLFRDIILGLRKEFLENQQKIKALKEYINYDLNKIDSFDIRVFVGSKNVVELLINIEKRQRRIIKLINDLRKRLGIYIWTAYDTKIVSEDGKYDIKDKDLGLEVDLEKREEFKAKVLELENSEFVKNTGIVYCNNVVDSLNSALNITPGFTYLYMQEGDLNGVSCDYDAKNDEIILMGTKNRPLRENDLEDMLNMQCKKDKLSLYHQTIIDNSSVFDKDIEIIGNPANMKTARFAVYENDFGYTFKKKKGKSSLV